MKRWEAVLGKAEDGNAVQMHEFSLPLVSIIITNYNYAEFILDAFRSVEAQSYANIECVIVDDASTDGSGVCLDEIATRRPDVKIIRKSTNAGQTAAFLTGFNASSGEYIVFLDADDLLLPAFVETHIFAHLSMRRAVGFTSSDLLQASGSRIVRPSMNCFADYVASGDGRRKNSFRRIDECCPQYWTGRLRFTDDFETRIHYVEPRNGRDWVYSPTSGNCYRRDALKLLLWDGIAIALKHNADTYLNKAAALLNGAALIDIPLTIYRIHGANGFVSHPDLFGMDSCHHAKCIAAEYHAWRVFADRLIDDAELFFHKLHMKRYREVMLAMQRTCRWKPEFREFDDLTTYLKTEMQSQSAALKSILGEGNYFALLKEISWESAKRPRPWLKPIAEFFLTLGRQFNAQLLSAFGERLWRI